MSAKPQRDTPSLIDPNGDDADRLRSLVSAMLSGTYPEDVWLRDVTLQCQADPAFGRSLRALIERYRRLGQIPAAQYERVRQKLEASLPAQSAARHDDRRPAGAGSARQSPRLPAIPIEATLTAPLPAESAQARPAAPAPRPGSPLPPRSTAAPAATVAPRPAAKSPAAPASEALASVAPTPAAVAATAQPAAAPPPPPPPPSGSTSSTALPPRPQETRAPAASHVSPSKTDLVVRPGTVLRERYELEGLLGRGGMATVYKAIDRYRASLGLPDCQVALKIVTPDSATPADDAALGREFHNAQQLSHPNIVNVFEIDHEAGATFYTMELLEGEQLDELLGRIGGPLPLPQALTVIRDIGAAIEHAHSRGILHADLKPQNVFVTFGGQVRILDFGGLSMPAPASSGPWIDEAALTAATDHYRTATPAYASCEQLEGEQVDSRDDIYALACIGYELITGRHPFDGHTALQARAQHLHARRPPQLSSSSWRALRRALSFRRAQRPRDIGPWLEQLGVAAAAARLPPSYELRAPAARSHWGRWVAVAASLALCAGAAVALMRQNPGPRDWNALVASARSSLQQARAGVQQRLIGPAPKLAQTGPRTDSQTAPAATRPTHHRRELPPLVASTAAPGAQRSPSGPAPSSAPPAAGASEPTVPEPTAPPAPTDDPAAATLQGVEFSSATYEVNDTSPAARVVVRRSGGTEDDLRFVWWTLDDTAKADVDYAPLGRRTEHLLPGQDHMTLYVPIISNPLRHETTTFYVALGRPGAGSGSPSARASVTIDRGG